MSVLVEPAPLPLRMPAHRAGGCLSGGVVRAVVVIALVLAADGIATLMLGLLGAVAGLVLTTAAAVFVRRHRMARAWQHELEAACGVHERKALNLTRVL